MKQKVFLIMIFFSSINLFAGTQSRDYLYCEHVKLIDQFLYDIKVNIFFKIARENIEENVQRSCSTDSIFDCLISANPYQTKKTCPPLLEGIIKTKYVVSRDIRGSSFAPEEEVLYNLEDVGCSNNKFLLKGRVSCKIFTTMFDNRDYVCSGSIDVSNIKGSDEVKRYEIDDWKDLVTYDKKDWEYKCEDYGQKVINKKVIDKKDMILKIIGL